MTRAIHALLLTVPMAKAIRTEPSSSHLSLPSTRTTSPYDSHGNYSADDERSTPSLLPSMSPSVVASLDSDDETELPGPAYDGEDTRPTSREELLGFYTYSFAAEVFVVCGLGAFIPITLEELARASATAVLASDHSKPCRSRNLDLAPPEGPSLLSPTDVTTPLGVHQCTFEILGTELNTASFAMYTFSLSVLLQALVVVTMSGAADHGRYRKSLMLMFAGVGSIATILFLVVTPRMYLLGSLWAIVGNVSFGASWVLLNSFLPLLVRHHPEVRQACRADSRSTVRGTEEVSPRSAFSVLVLSLLGFCLVKATEFRAIVTLSNSLRTLQLNHAKS